MKEFQHNMFFHLGLFFLLFSSSHSDISAAGKHKPVQHRKDLSLAAGYGEERLSSVLITGTVICHTCLKGSNEYHMSYVTGAKIAAKCNVDGKRKTINYARGTTDEYGDFILDLPSHLHGNPNLQDACSVRVLRLPKNSICRRNYGMKTKGISLSSVGNGIRVYTTGVIKLEHHASVGSHSCLKRGDGGVERAW